VSAPHDRGGRRRDSGGGVSGANGGGGRGGRARSQVARPAPVVREGVTGPDIAIVAARGAARLAQGHPWIFRSDLLVAPTLPAGVVRMRTAEGRPLGVALWSPASEISLRRIDHEAEAIVDVAWWHRRIGRAIARRAALRSAASALRLVHGEADGLPSLVVDQYDRWLVVQLLSAGLEAHREAILAALLAHTGAEGVLARNDPSTRTREGLPREVTLLHGVVPEEITVHEHGVRFLAAPWRGQKTGAFLDQRENRALVGRLARGRALDCFAYHGSFALHLARQASEVVAVDVSEPALARARENAALNGFTNVRTEVGDAFDVLRAWHRAGERFDTIVVDPPAFAKSRATVDAALRGYKEINLRAMRLLAPGGLLFSASCSHHVGPALFLEMLRAAAADSGRSLFVRATTGHAADHPEVITIPETGYLKGVLLEAAD
jgi:23S rRNA (cytosine1962-C5)-methyltransferase